MPLSQGCREHGLPGAWEAGVIGFLAFVAGTATVCALTLIDPSTARWFALAILGVLFVCSAMPRRKERVRR